MSTQEFIEAEKKAEERQKLINDALKELALFDLKLDDKPAEYQREEECGTSSLSYKELDILNGIDFFDDNSFCCLYSEDVLRSEGIQSLQLKALSLDKLLIYLNDHRTLIAEKPLKVKKDVLTFCFRVLAASRSELLLADALSVIVKILSTDHYSYIRVIFSLIDSVIENIGGKIGDKVEEDLKSLASGENINVVLNVKYIILALSHALNRELKHQILSSTSDIAKLDDLLMLILKMSQDSRILSSDILFHIKNCVSLILDVYPENCDYPVKVQDFVERLGRYWDMNYRTFNHSLACQVLSDVIPMTNRGKKLRSSLAFYSLMCCLEKDEVIVSDDILISGVADFCDENFQSFRNQNCFTIYSLLRMINATIPRPLWDEKDKRHVSRLVDFLGAVHSTIPATDKGKQMVHRLIKVLESQWRLLLADNEKRMRQRTVSEMLSENPYSSCE